MITNRQMIAAQLQIARRLQLFGAYSMMNSKVVADFGFGKNKEVKNEIEFKDAISNAKPGTTVSLVSDINLNDVTGNPIVLADKTTLNLNGKKLSVKSSSTKFAFVVENGHEAILQNGELEINGRGIKVDGGKLVCKNIKAYNLNSRFAAAYGNETTRNGAELVIDKDCILEGNTTDQIIGVYGFETHVEGKDNAVIKCTISGKIINKNEDLEHFVAPIATYGSDIWSNTEIIIEDGAVVETSNKKNSAIYLPGKGKLILNGGVIRGGTGIYTKGAEIIVPAESKVKIFATATADEVDEVVFDGNGNSNSGECITIDNCNTNGKEGIEAIYAIPMKHEIAGGEFESANGKEIGSYATTRNGLEQREKFSKFISGGKFAHTVAEELIADGKTCKEDGDAFVISSL